MIYERVIQFKTPKPKLDLVLMCACMNENLFNSNRSRNWGRFKKGLQKEILLSRAFYLIEKNCLTMI